MDNLIKTIINIIKTDAEKAALPVIQSYIGDLIANPSQINIVAKTGKLIVDLQAALPDLQAQVTKDLLVILNTEIAALATQSAVKA